ncbi:MAG: DUF1178 family protein [Sphingomonadales bacterium]|nr:DUF1178 family protein [Sphingomonadales bacterium]MDE2169986.1 DUF1178 family protein [Sphingomonadales bacterium]
MIVYDLICEDDGHGFEGWFGSSQDFDQQQARGLVTCPHCGGAQVVKAVMAPRLTRKGNQQVELARKRKPVVEEASSSPSQAIAALPPEARAALQALAKAQAEALKSSRWVGENFAQDVRAMHYGDKAPEAVHGQTTADEARSLIEEGVAIAPVLFPVAAPDEIN